MYTAQKRATKGGKTLYSYYEKAYKEMQDSDYATSTKKGWSNNKNYLQKYKEAFISLERVDSMWLNGYSRFLDKCESYSGNVNKKKVNVARPISDKTKAVYISIMRKVLRKAYREGMIPEAPSSKIAPYQGIKHSFTYITVEDMKKLDATYCMYPTVKKAFLFSCLTGIRGSDLEKLVWNDVIKDADTYKVRIVKTKAKESILIDISSHAVKYLGKRQKNEDLVFPDLCLNTSAAYEIKRWAFNAGILNLDISFYTARHSYAMMMLKLGTSPIIVGELMGFKVPRQNMKIYLEKLEEESKSVFNTTSRNCPIRLIEKKLHRGRRSLYLEIDFQDTTYTECLHIFLEAASSEDKLAANIELINQANDILEKRKQEIIDGTYTPPINRDFSIIQKIQPNGDTKLFLEMYHDGKRTTEFMKLYLVPDNTPIDNERNRLTLELANTIMAMRREEYMRLKSN